jgi:hypothetical protein
MANQGMKLILLGIATIITAGFALIYTQISNTPPPAGFPDVTFAMTKWFWAFLGAWGVFLATWGYYKKD